jgi:hypothetical protein
MAWTEAWPSRKVDNLKRGLKTAEAMVRTPERGQTLEVTAALARFLVVRACGYLEQVSEECCKAYLVGKSMPRVAGFGSRWLGRGANPTSPRLVELVHRFDANWAIELETFLQADDELLWQQVNHLVGLRNQVAHGENEGTGTVKALELVGHAEMVADWFVNRFDPR